MPASRIRRLSTHVNTIPRTRVSRRSSCDPRFAQLQFMSCAPRSPLRMEALAASRPPSPRDFTVGQTCCMHRAAGDVPLPTESALGPIEKRSAIDVQSC